MIHDNIYSVPALVFLAILLIGWYVSSTLRYRSKMAKLGGSAPVVPYYLPFGWDTLWTTIEVPRTSYGSLIQ